MSDDTIKTDLKQKKFLIDHIPAILLGEPSDKIYLFVHGQSGNKEEAVGFAEVAAVNTGSIQPNSLKLWTSRKTRLWITMHLCGKLSKTTNNHPKRRRVCTKECWTNKMNQP